MLVVRTACSLLLLVISNPLFAAWVIEVFVLNVSLMATIIWNITNKHVLNRFHV